MSTQVAEVYDKMVRLGTALGVKNIKDLPGAWVQRVDDEWMFAINGRDETLCVQPDENTMPANLPFGIAAVWFNGWMAGTLDPFGGVFVVGMGANEDKFIEALDRAIGLVTT